MTDHTPADKPDLPALRRSIETWTRCDPAAMANQSQAAIYFAFQDLLSDVQTLARALADERRKARAEPIAELKPVAYLMREDIDELRKTGRRAAVIYSESISPLDVPLAIIPDTKE